MTSSQVAYLISRYPGLSLAFIEREIAGLRALGVRVDTYSVRPPVPSELLTARMRQEAATTPVLLDSRRRLIHETFKLLRGHPGTYAHMLGLARRSGPPHLRGRLWQLFYLTEAVRLRADLVARGVRHLHVHFANNGADVARLVTALGRALDGPDAGWRWTMSMHGPTELENVIEFDLAEKVADAAAVACISDFTRSQLMRLLPPTHWNKLSVVRMSVDTDRFSPPAEPRTLRSNEAARVLCVGRLVPEKGAPILLEAVRALVDRGHRLQVKIVGQGPLEALLKATVSDLGLDDTVELTGPLGQDDLPALYDWADVFCLPSFQEGLPVVLMEAMASGLPVVTTRIAGIPELVDDTNGRIVEAGRADLLAGALADLLDDRQLQASLGQVGRQRVQAQFAIGTTARAQAAFLARAHDVLAVPHRT